MKNIKDYIEFANKYPTAFLATIDGDKPRVRGLWMWFADETGFYFHTGSNKNLYKQLKANPNVEASFCSNQQQNNMMVRISGKVEFVSDKMLMDRLMTERAFLLAPMKEAMGDKAEIVIFRINTGEAYYWDMKNNLDENNNGKVIF